MSDDDSLAQRILHGAGALGLVALILALAVAASMCGCSSGPQLPIVTTPISISCTWNGMDGGAIEDCDCLVDRSSAQAEGNPVGNVVRDVRVDPTTSVQASGTSLGGAP